MGVTLIYTFQWPFLKPLGIPLKDTAQPLTIETVAWTAKVVFGILSDRFNLCNMGYRRPYIIGGQLLTTLGFLVIVWVLPKPGTGWGVYLFSSFIRGVGMATASVAVEGLAVDANIPERMGLIQNSMAAGRLVGLLWANLLGSHIAEKYGFSALCIFSAVTVFPLVALPMALGGWVVEERLVGRVDAKFEFSAFRALASRDTLALLLFAVSNNVGSTIASFVGTPFLTEERGFSLSNVGALGIVSAVFMFPGAALAGWVMDNADLRWPMVLATVVNATTNVLNIWTPRSFPDAMGFQTFLGVAGGLAQGMIYVTIVGLAMRSAPQGVSASYVSIVLGISNASGILGNLWAGEISGSFTNCFITGGAVAVAGLFSLFLFTPLSYRPLMKKALQEGGGLAPVEEGGKTVDTLVENEKKGGSQTVVPSLSSTNPHQAFEWGAVSPLVKAAGCR